MLDTVNLQWTQFSLTSPPSPRFLHLQFAHQNTLFIYGGVSPSADNLADCKKVSMKHLPYIVPRNIFYFRFFDQSKLT